MSILFPNSVRRILSKFTFEIDNNSADIDLSCLICKKLMIDAYQSYCACQFCHDCIVEYLSDKGKKCPGGKIDCEEEDLNMDGNVSRNSVLNRQILRLKVLCPNKSCRLVIELDKMDAHLRMCSETLSESIIDGAEKSDISETFTHSQLLINLINNLRSEIHDQKLEINVLIQNAKKKDKLFEDQRDEIDKHTKAIETLKEKSLTKKAADHMLKSMNEDRPQVSRMVDTIEQMRKDLHSNAVLLTVSGFKEKIEKCVDIVGPAFYTHLNGYKLKLLVYPGGIRKGKGTHLSMFFVLCSGEYDDILPWPCKYTISIGIVNQKNNETHQGVTYDYSTIVEGHKYLFHKPSNKDNEACGYSNFISHSELKSVTGLIVDDSVVIRCLVSAPSNKSV